MHLAQRLSCSILQALLKSYGVSTELVEVQNLITVGVHILEAALSRRESRGGHFNVDYPPSFLGAPSRSPDLGARQSGAKKLQKRVARDKDMGGSVRGASPPRSRPKQRDIVFRSQKEDQD